MCPHLAPLPFRLSRFPSPQCPFSPYTRQESVDNNCGADQGGWLWPTVHGGACACLRRIHRPIRTGNSETAVGSGRPVRQKPENGRHFRAPLSEAHQGSALHGGVHRLGRLRSSLIVHNAPIGADCVKAGVAVRRAALHPARTAPARSARTLAHGTEVTVLGAVAGRGRRGRRSASRAGTPHLHPDRPRPLVERHQHPPGRRTPAPLPLLDEGSPGRPGAARPAVALLLAASDAPQGPRPPRGRGLPHGPRHGRGPDDASPPLPRRAARPDPHGGPGVARGAPWHDDHGTRPGRGHPPATAVTTRAYRARRARRSCTPSHHWDWHYWMAGRKSARRR